MSTEEDNNNNNNNSGNDWERNIETLLLNHKHLIKIENLDPFINLRKL